MEAIVSIPLLKDHTLSPEIVDSVLSQDGISRQLFVTAEKQAEVPDFLYSYPKNLVCINTSLIPGIAGCHNYVLMNNKAEYFFLLAPDTLLLPGALADLLHEMRAHPEIALAFGSGYYASNNSFNIDREEFRRQYSHLEIRQINRAAKASGTYNIIPSQLDVIAVNGLASTLIHQGLYPEYKALAPFEFVLRAKTHSVIRKHTSALTITSYRTSYKPSIGEIFGFLYQTSLNLRNNTFHRSNSIGQIFTLINIFFINAVEGTNLFVALQKYLYKLRHRSFKNPFAKFTAESIINRIGSSLWYRNLSESQKNLRTLRKPRAVQSSKQNGKKISYVLWQFPVYGETFIRREINQLLSLGVNIQVFADDPDPNLIEDEAINTWVERTVYPDPINTSRLVALLLFFFFRHPIKTTKLFLYILFHRHSYYKTLREDLVVFSKTLNLTKLLKKYGIQHIHSPWANLTAFKCIGAAYLLDLPFTVHVRAYDINHWKSQYGLVDILENADYIFTNSEYNQSRINLITRSRKEILLVRDGLDPSKIIANERQDHSGSPIRILSVGRLIEPKGYIYLLQACSLLVKKGINYKCKIVGGSDFIRETRTYLDIMSTYHTLQLENWVSFEGACSFGEILKSYQWADIFVLPCVKSQTGEHDITPNVILEAMAMELPVVSTTTGAIPEIITHHKNGLLVDPGDLDALAESIHSLILNPDLRKEYGKAGRKQVIKNYNISRNISKILDVFN
jgi:glycosyltransferase involved in cell wall biosynthesis